MQPRFKYQVRTNAFTPLNYQSKVLSISSETVRQLLLISGIVDDTLLHTKPKLCAHTLSIKLSAFSLFLTLNDIEQIFKSQG